MTSPNSHPILKTLKDTWTQVRTFLTDSFQVLYLVAYLGTRLLLLLVSLALEKLFSGNWKEGKIPPLWDGKTAERIINHVLQFGLS